MITAGANGLTLADLARESGYSVDTVRDVFRTGTGAKGRVKMETAQSVLDAAERIGFYPFSQRGQWAKVLRTGTGVLVIDGGDVC